jgi:hypothetical protein
MHNKPLASLANHSSVQEARSRTKRAEDIERITAAIFAYKFYGRLGGGLVGSGAASSYGSVEGVLVLGGLALFTVGLAGGFYVQNALSLADGTGLLGLVAAGLVAYLAVGVAGWVYRKEGEAIKALSAPVDALFSNRRWYREYNNSHNNIGGFKNWTAVSACIASIYDAPEAASTASAAGMFEEFLDIPKVRSANSAREKEKIILRRAKAVRAYKWYGGFAGGLVESGVLSSAASVDVVLVLGVTAGLVGGFYAQDALSLADGTGLLGLVAAGLLAYLAVGVAGWVYREEGEAIKSLSVAVDEHFNNDRQWYLAHYIGSERVEAKGDDAVCFALNQLSPEASAPPLPAAALPPPAAAAAAPPPPPAAQHKGDEPQQHHR